mmetsp:Transcript_109779/g.310591  ORF Transcript_109779/g.310591 Transcript_109779/m.310591 type:complete len:221 (+) Transcript_109779:1281-1943(+)
MPRFGLARLRRVRARRGDRPRADTRVAPAGLRRLEGGLPEEARGALVEELHYEGARVPRVHADPRHPGHGLQVQRHAAGYPHGAVAPRRHRPAALRAQRVQRQLRGFHAEEDDRDGEFVAWYHLQVGHVPEPAHPHSGTVQIHARRQDHVERVGAGDHDAGPHARGDVGRLGRRGVLFAGALAPGLLHHRTEVRAGISDGHHGAGLMSAWTRCAEARVGK